MKYKVISAIAAIVILEGIALFRGIDGAVFGLAIAAIAGLGGYTISELKKPK